MMATTTRHEELIYRLSRRRSLGILTVGLLLTSLFIAGYAVKVAPTGSGLSAMIMALLTAATGVAALFLRNRIPTQADPALPVEADLPLDDPRVHRSLGKRRLLWLTAGSIWVSGWVVGLSAATVLDISPWYRMSVFLGVTWASVMLGAWLMRRWTGSTSWPRKS